MFDRTNGPPWQGIAGKLSNARFAQFIVPYLSSSCRSPATTLSFHTKFNYVLHLLYLSCQWQNLPIENNQYGHREIHPTKI